MSMTSWENQFQELKQQFIFRSRERLAAIENLLEQMQYRPGDFDLLRQIMKHFHWLAGSGGTYGFDEITQWGTYGEELCEYLLKLQVPVKSDDRDKLLSAFETVQILFASASPEEPTSNSGDASVQMVSSTAELLVAPKPAQNDLRSETTGSTLSSGYQRTGEYNTNAYTGGGSGSSYHDGGTSASYSGAGPSYVGGVSGSLYTGGNTASPYSSGGGTSYTGSGSGSSYAERIEAFTGRATSNPNDSESSGETIITSYTGPNSVNLPGAGPASSNPSGPGSASATPYGGGSVPGLGSSGFSSASASGSSTTGAYNRPTSEHRIPSTGDLASTPPQAKPPLVGPPLTSGSVIQEPPPHTFGAGIRQTGEFARPRLTHVPLNKPLAILLDSGACNLSPLKTALEERSIHVESFASGAVVRSLFSERLPDYLIVTLPLADSDGYELIEYMRSLDGGHRPAVLMLGQQAAFIDKVMAIRAGANAFFEYPAEHQELLQKLTDLAELNQPITYKILSVEDDQNQADFIKLTLETAGYKVFHLADAKKFEDAFLSFEPDLVLLDVMLGDVTGFELARYIRQNDRFAALPIVFLTTQNKLHQHIRSAIAGGDEHLVKPVAPQLLIATVASRLEKARALKKLIDRDGLTRCLNYGTFMERSQRIVAPENFRNAPSLMMIDIDNLTMINEQFGFANGDRVISNISNILLKGFRNTDMIARFGNDQFAIILEHLTDVQLQSLASQVLSAIGNTPQILKGRNVTVTCSCGVAALEQGMSMPAWVSAAEEALKKAKEGGKNRAIVRPSGKGNYR